MAIFVAYFKSVFHRRRWTVMTAPPFLVAGSNWLIAQLAPLPPDLKMASVWLGTWWEWGLAILVCFSVAQFFAWHEEYKKVKALEKAHELEVEALRRDFELATKIGSSSAKYQFHQNRESINSQAIFVAEHGTAILNPPSIGNLKPRAKELVFLILEQLERNRYNPKRLVASGATVTAETSKLWATYADDLFRWRFLKEVIEIRKEFADLNIKNSHVDSALESEEMIFVGGGRFLPVQIKLIAEGISAMADVLDGGLGRESRGPVGT